MNRHEGKRGALLFVLAFFLVVSACTQGIPGIPGPIRSDLRAGIQKMAPPELRSKQTAAEIRTASAVLSKAYKRLEDSSDSQEVRAADNIRNGLSLLGTGLHGLMGYSPRHPSQQGVVPADSVKAGLDSLSQAVGNLSARRYVVPPNTAAEMETAIRVLSEKARKLTPAKYTPQEDVVDAIREALSLVHASLDIVLTGSNLAVGESRTANYTPFHTPFDLAASAAPIMETTKVEKEPVPLADAAEPAPVHMPVSTVSTAAPIMVLAMAEEEAVAPPAAVTPVPVYTPVSEAPPAAATIIAMAETEAEPLPAESITPAPAPVVVPAAFTPPEDSGIDLQESFIEIRVTTTRGDSFYRVMVDENENPYLDVGESLGLWLDMPPECDYARQYCQATMQPKGTLYWIDGVEMQIGDSGNGIHPIPKDALAFKEGRLWLRYDVWEDWFPLTATWSLTYYTLGFNPHFPLLADLKKQRERQRQAAEAERLRRERLALLPARKPDSGPPEGRYRIDLERDPDGNQAATLRYDLAADIYAGTALVGGEMVKADQGDRSNLTFWRYRQLRQPHYYQLEVGDTRSDVETLMGAFNLENGVRIDRLQRHKGAGIFEFRDRTQPGTEIDFYHNGFLVETFIAGADGTFEIPEQFVSGGDRVVLRYYFPDGSEFRRIIRITYDNARILPAGVWDGQFLAGETEPGGFTRVAWRYGMRENLSGGFALMQFPKAGTTGGESGYMIDLAWRPFHGLTLLTDQLITDAGHDYEFSADITGGARHIFQLELRHLADGSPLFTLPGQAATSNELIRLRHIYRRSRLSWQAELSDTEVDQQFKHRADLRILRRLSVYNQGTFISGGPNDNLDTNTVGVTFGITRSMLLEGSRTFAEPEDSWTARFRIQGGHGWDRWDANVSVTQFGDADPEGSAALTWRITPRFNVSATGTDDGVTARLSWLDIIAAKPGPTRWDDFGSGTLYGRVAAPGLEGEEPFPLEGVMVRAGNRTTTTDADGNYQMTGIAADQRVNVSVERNSLDATMAPANDGVPVLFRPGTRIHHDPAVTWTAGLDGFVLTAGGQPVPKGTEIHVLNLTDDQVVSRAEVEEDGFFLIEGLTPGAYRLGLSGVENPPQPRIFKLPPGTDWLSGVTLDWQ